MSHFRTSDGTRVWYEVSGPPAGRVVVLCDGVACDGYAWKYLTPRLLADHRVLHVHYRGHGRSGLPRDLGRCTLPVLARDHVEILDALGIPEATFIGHSMGCQLILELAFREPGRVRGGVLVCGSYGRALDSLKNSDLGRRMLPYLKGALSNHRGVFEAIMRLVLPNRLGFALATLSEINKDKVRREDFMPYLDHVARMSHELVGHMLTDAAERTSLDFLGRITQPMLVIAAETDGFMPPHTAKRMADALARAEFRVLFDATHTAPIEEPERLWSHIDAFLQRTRDSLPEAAGTAVPSLLQAWSAAREPSKSEQCSLFSLRAPRETAVGHSG